MPRAAKKTVTTKKRTTVKKGDTAADKTLMPKPAAKKTVFLRMWLLAIVLLVILGLAYLGKGLFVVAMVNGRPVSRLALIKNLEKTGGKAELNNMITEELISQQAQKEHIVVSDSDVQKEIDKITKSAESQGTTLDAALATRGMTKSDLEKNIKLQKTVEALLSSQLSVSEDDVKKYFEDNKDLYGANAKYEDLKDSVKNDLQQEKFSSEFQKWYQKLQSESDIKYFVTY